MASQPSTARVTGATPEGGVGSQAMLTETLEDLRQLYGSSWNQQAIVGLNMEGLFIVVKLASGATGICFNYDVAEELLPPPAWAMVAEGLMGRVQAGERLLDSILSNRSGQSQLWEQALSMAIISALSQPFLAPAALQAEGVRVERGRKRLDDMCPQGKSVFIIGFGGYFPEAVVESHFERVVCADFYFQWPGRSDFYRERLRDLGQWRPGLDLVLTSGEDTSQHLRECDLIVITGSALANGSMESLLAQISPHARVAIEGPSAALLPHAYFRRRVNYVAQTVMDLDVLPLAQRFWRQKYAGDIPMGFGYYMDMLLPTFQTLSPAG